MKKHTPAPWTKRRDDDETITILGKYSGTTIKIAEVYNTTDDETDADLILTAPELLTALEIATATLETVVRLDPANIAAKVCIERNRYTIARAYGR